MRSFFFRGIRLYSFLRPDKLFLNIVTPSNRVFLEKLTDFQLAKKFVAFYGT